MWWSDAFHQAKAGTLPGVLGRGACRRSGQPEGEGVGKNRGARSLYSSPPLPPFDFFGSENFLIMGVV